jgi:hypothetical protein
MQSFCGSETRTNVAAFDCDKAREFPAKLTLGGKKFSAADCADADTYKAAKIAATKLDTGNPDKLFVINSILDPNDVSEQNKKGAVGEGIPRVLVEGRPAFTYRVEIGQDLFKRLRKLNGRRIPIWTLDNAGNDWGAVNSAGEFVGATGYFWISGNTQTTASTPVSALIEIAYVSSKQYNDEAVYMPVDLGELEPEGLLDVNLRYISNSTNVYKIAFDAPTAQFEERLNMAKKYATELVAGLFNAKTGATFATTLAITSVSYDATLEVLTITFDSTAYTALASGTKIKLYLDDVATLEAAGIENIEGVPVILTK